MIALSEATLKVVLYEGPGTSPMEADRRRQVLAELLDAGYAVTRATCPCGIEPDDSAVAILGLFDGAPPPAPAGQGQGRLAVRDVSGKDACGTLEAVEEVRESLALPKPGGWVPWFPVIDYDRCVGCRQCASFCIFGVYATGGEPDVLVAQPDHCKTNCPACARMCPKVAIIFPKYGQAPIDGAAVNEADVRRERAGTDLKKVLQGDLFAMLRQRGAAGTPAAGAGTPGAGAEVPPRVLMALDVAQNAAGEAGDCGCRTRENASGATDCGCAASAAGDEEDSRANQDSCAEADSPGDCDCACGCDCGEGECQDGDCDCPGDCACHAEGDERE